MGKEYLSTVVYAYILQRRRQDFGSGGDILGGRPRRSGGGGRAPTDAGEVSKNFKNVLRKKQKMHYFSIFFKKFNKNALIFRPFGRKTQIVGKF